MFKSEELLSRVAISRDLDKVKRIVKSAEGLQLSVKFKFKYFFYIIFVTPDR